MKKAKSYTGNYIFVVPSFVKGMGSVLSIAGNYYNPSHNIKEKTDCKAIESDWAVVGRSICNAQTDVKICSK